jgi:hypothetical protein
VKASKGQKSAVVKDREIEGGHLLRCWWLQKLGFSLDPVASNWDGRPRLLRFYRSSSVKIETFLSGESNSVDHVDLVLPLVSGEFRIHFGEPFLKEHEGENLLHFRIKKVEYVREDSMFADALVDAKNKHSFTNQLMDSLWRLAEAKFSVFRSTEEWKALTEKISVWAELAGQLYNDLDHLYTRLPTVRVRFPDSSTIRFEVPHAVNPTVSTEVKVDSSRLPFPDCDVKVTSIKRGEVTLERAVAARIADEMVQAFKSKKGFYGMARVFAHSAAQFNSKTYGSMEID